MDESRLPIEVGEGVALPADGAEGEQVLAWEEINAGRYMPRRIRGSCRGRELG
jgi:hypothetical protein